MVGQSVIVVIVLQDHQHPINSMVMEFTSRQRWIVPIRLLLLGLVVLIAINTEEKLISLSFLSPKTDSRSNQTTSALCHNETAFASPKECIHHVSNQKFSSSKGYNEAESFEDLSLSPASAKEMTTQSIKIYLVGKRKKSVFVYYEEIISAVSKHPSVTICDKDLSGCLEDDQDIPLVILFTPETATEVGPLQRELMATAEQVNSSRMDTSKKPRPLYVSMFINKVYHSLEDKVRLFKTSFPSSLVSSRIIFTWSPHASEWTRLFGLPFVFVPFGVTFDKFQLKSTPTPWDERSCDILVRWDDNPTKYEMRREIDELIERHNSAGSETVVVSTSTGQNITVRYMKRFLRGKDYIKQIADCRFVASTIGMPGRFDLVGTRYYEVAAVGTSLLLVERTNADNYLAYRDLQIVDGNNTVGFDNLGEFWETILFYRKQWGAAKTIIAQAQRWAQKQSWEERAERIVSSLLKLQYGT